MNDLIAVEKIAQWEKLKALVLDSVSSPITKRVYNMAPNEFMAWFQQAAVCSHLKITGRVAFFTSSCQATSRPPPKLQHFQFVVVDGPQAPIWMLLLLFPETLVAA
jgi:hypothetical protein